MRRIAARRKRLFEDFLSEAGEKIKSKQEHQAKQIYLSARALEFDKWVLFVSEML